MTRAGVLILALLLSGCAIVETYGPTGALTERRLTVGSPVVVAPTHDAPAVRVRGAGALYMGGSAILGYGDLTMISADRPCSAFLFVNSASEALRFAALVNKTNRVCNGE